jgi:gamma-glutamyltranspeptidase/glutathione hydrolase
MGKRSLAVASNGAVADAANAVVARGNAVDAVVGGVFAAAADAPGVLLGPVQILIGGAGAGLRAVDGRVRQPGRGAPRPRGFRAEDEVPRAASVGVPALPAALAAAHATAGSATLLTILGPAVDCARAASPERGALFARLAQRGPAALVDAAFSSDFLAAVGRVAGGNVTNEDLEELRPVVTAAVAYDAGSRRVARVPWLADGAERDATRAQVVLAIDAHGLVAAACYEAVLTEDGLPIPELGLVAPLLATPVRRGEPRVKPGEAHVAPAPIALVGPAGSVDMAMGVAAHAEAERLLVDAIGGLDTGLRAGLALLRGAGEVRALRPV